MAARQLNAKKPQDLRYTLRMLLSYMGRHKFILLLVAILVTISAVANLLGTYMIRPVVNNLASGNIRDLLMGVLLTAAIYGVGALSAYGYTQAMVKAAQQVLYDIRRDLFAHLQTLPLKFFDNQRHGDVMSYFTNGGHAGHPVHPQLAAFDDRGCVLCRDVLVHPVQRQTQQNVLHTPAGKLRGFGWLH